MKTTKRLKAILLILVIVLITILSFSGVYNILSVNGDNLVKDYKLGMELKGKRIVRLKVDDTVNEVTYDSEGNEVETQEDEGEYTVEQQPVNAPELLNKENYKKAVEIIEDRVNYMDAQEYRLRFDEENGIIELEMIDDELADYIIEAIRVQGDFRIIDEETQEVLLDRSSVKKASLVYRSQDGVSRTVYLDIEFNKDGAKKLEEVSKTYVKTTEQVVNEEETEEETTEQVVDEEGEAEEQTTEQTIEKKVVVKIDDSTLISTSFQEPLANGHLYISMGQAATNNEELRKATLQASVQAAVIDSDTVPVVYTVEQDKYILTNMTKDIIPIVAVITLAIEAIILIVIFKLKGIVATILQIGYVALLVLVLKCTNVYITLEGVCALVLATILNLALTYKILVSVRKDENVLKAINENLIKFINISIPVLIIAIIFCFMRWLEISSFGMVLFWGYVVLILYNIVFTKGILKNTCEK